MAIFWFGTAAVVYMAGYSNGTHDMWMAVKDLLK
jgi:hypothetical protein